MECLMRSKLSTCVAALAVAAPVILVAGAPASAQRWHERGFAPGLAAGAAIGSAAVAAVQPWRGPGYSYYGGYYDPGYVYSSGYAATTPYAYAPDNDEGYVYGAAPGAAAPGRDD